MTSALVLIAAVWARETPAFPGALTSVRALASTTVAEETYFQNVYENLFANYAAAAPDVRTRIIEQILVTDPLTYDHWKLFADAVAKHHEAILADYAAPADEMLQLEVCKLLALYCADVRYKLDYDEQLPRRISQQLVADFLKRPKGAALLKGHLDVLAQMSAKTRGAGDAVRIVREYVDSPDPDIQTRAIPAYANLCGLMPVPERQVFVAREYDKLIAFLRQGELTLPVLKILSEDDYSACTKKNLDIFLRFLEERENRPVCESAIAIVGRIQDPRSIKALLDAVRAPSRGSGQDRLAALYLKDLGNLDAVPILTDRLEKELAEESYWPRPYGGGTVLTILDEITGQQPIPGMRPSRRLSNQTHAITTERNITSLPSGETAPAAHNLERGSYVNVYMSPRLTKEQVWSAVAFYRDFWKKRQAEETQASPKAPME
jgi:hypothetical protein